MKVALIGTGKMGLAVAEILSRQGDEIVLRVNAENRTPDDDNALKQADVAIEFTQPEAVIDNILWCFSAGVPVVVGTTGWHQRQEEMKAACHHYQGTLFHAPNFSIGVNLFFETVRHLGQLMNTHPEYDFNIEEIHHTEKKDAPSGTAIRTADILLNAISRKTSWHLNATAADQIAIKAIREPGIPGTHTVTFKSAADTLVVQHTAHSRQGFAEGAVAAARFVVGKKGWFEMKDLLHFPV
ncbi:MAG: 4-hydroxy-tetrahydrodipicolinate reductase [Chitinophagales bacterium]